MIRAAGGLAAALLLWSGGTAHAADVLVEAESFADPGGWVVDQQFMDIMGSPYLLAHGMGVPVAPARTQVEFPAPGTYHLWVRTKDWVPSHHPGIFKVVIDGVPAPTVFGNQGQGWIWQKGGTVEVRGKKVNLELSDLTGFDGRCDALYFTTEAAAVPPNEPGEKMEAWRRKLLGMPDVPPSAGQFDVVVVGGGISGTAAAVAAARLGCTVALIHDRPVLGGNNSPEVRVHTGGASSPIVSEINGAYGSNPQDPKWLKEPSGPTQTAERRQKVVDGEQNIKSFLGWHAIRATRQGNRIASVDAKNIQTNEERRFAAPVFIDSTGDGSVGAWVGAEFRVGREAKAEFNEPTAPDQADGMTLGTSLLWGTRETDHETKFPDVPWATEVSKDLAAASGNWTWEYGHYKDTIKDAEEIRDYLLRAIYGSWCTAHNVKDTAKYARTELAWVPYVGGKRESRRLMGDYLLTENDVLECKQFPDGVATGSWSIDLHYPKGYEFRTYAQMQRVKPYPIPYRCLYSKNVDNLMMAGRDVSVTHVALGTTRVMNTCGQMGVATGVAAAICKKHGTTPRGVYEKHLQELIDTLEKFGQKAGVVSGGGAGGGATPRAPGAYGMKIGTLDASAMRFTDGRELAGIPEAFLGLPYVTIERGPATAPAPGYAFMIDKPATVYIAVHQRGDAGLPAGWEKTDRKMTWTPGKGAQPDVFYSKAFPAGKVEIPGHAGKDGGNFGAPHLAVIGSKDVKVTEAKAEK